MPPGKQGEAKKRQRLIDKANKLLSKPASIEKLSKRGGKKYLKSDGILVVSTVMPRYYDANLLGLGRDPPDDADSLDSCKVNEP